MFLSPQEDMIVNLGAEITFLKQLVEAQKKELEQKKDQIVALSRTIVELQNGHERTRQEVADTEGGEEEQSLFGQCGDMDDRSGSYINGGSAEGEKGLDLIRRAGR